MHLVPVLATELTHRTLWYPTILGVLVVVFAVTLFCGSAYLLLATNVGARLGFLIAVAGLSGFMVVLSFLWITTASPLNTLRGRLPGWQVQEVVKTTGDSKFPAVRDIADTGRVLSPTDGANIKAFVDEALVRQVATGSEELPADANRLAQFDAAADFLVVNTYQLGGSHPNPLKLQFRHDTQYSAVEICPVLDQSAEAVFGLAPPAPKCNPAKPTEFVVLRYDYGSLRVPPFVAFITSILCFGLSLLALHWWERDANAAKKAAAAPPVPRPDPVPVDA